MDTTLRLCIMTMLQSVRLNQNETSWFRGAGETVSGNILTDEQKKAL